MSERDDRVDWIIFLLLGFFWGSSYLFIKLAVDDFGTFTLVALRLIVGAILLWLVIRIAGQQLPRDRRIYRHLIVMSIINITIPFLLITWAEQSVESSLAAILTSPVPLFAIVLSAIFLPDEPMRVNGLVGLAVGFLGVIIITSRGLDGTDDSPLIGVQALFAIVWLGILGSGLAYLFVFRLFQRWGATRTTLVAYLLPVVGIVLGYLFLQEPVDATIIVGTALVIAGIGLVNSRFGRRRLFGRTPVEAT